MNAAAIGLIGVVVGALLAGTINLALDRRSRLAKAKIAGRLIGVELDTAAEKIASAIKASKSSSGTTNGSLQPVSASTPQEGKTLASSRDGSQHTASEPEQRPAVDSTGWWMGDLPTDAWKQHQSNLAIDVRPKVLEIVARAYALCAVLNDEHAEARTPKVKPQGDLDKAAQAVTLAQQWLVDEPKIRDRRTSQRLARWSPALVLTTLVLVLAILALLTPRVDVNSASVTSAVQRGMGSGMLVQCNPGPGDWACTAYPPSWSTSSSSASTAAFFVQPGPVDYASAALAPALSTRSRAAQPISFTADVDGRDVFAAVVEQSGHVHRIKEIASSLDTSSALQRFLRSIFG